MHQALYIHNAKGCSGMSSNMEEIEQPELGAGELHAAFCEFIPLFPLSLGVDSVDVAALEARSRSKSA
jgi:hypothetical protein